MRNPKLLLFLTGALALAGCNTSTPERLGEPPPPRAGRVQVLVYDSTPRPKTDRLDVYDVKMPDRSYKVIAPLTCEGAAEEEVLMTRAIFYRARQIGADGVLSGTAAFTQKGEPIIYGVGGASKTRCVFRARAIVYQDK